MANTPGYTQLFALFNEIGIVAQLSSTRFERSMPEGLTTSQFSVLNNFVRLGGTRTPKQLADAFQVTKGAMTNTLSKLDARGCIRIRKDPDDKRSKIVSITAKGKRLRDEAVKSAQPAFEDIAELHSEKDVVHLISMLRQIRVQLDTNR